MYDILQLNDLLVPELLDIAEQLHIPDAKNLNKQELIYKILDNQAVMASENKNGTEKPRRKRTVKATTANTSEEAEVMSGDGVKAKAEKPKLEKRKEKEEKAAKPAEETPITQKNEAPQPKKTH